MDYRRLGATDLTVSALAFGTGPIGELFGPVDQADALRIIDEAIELGINFIDTSPYYGNAEYRLGKALIGKRDSIIVGTKAGRYGFDDFDFSPARVRASVENSLRLLETDYVDVLQLHDIEFVPLDGVLGESYQELVRLKTEGKCRYIGMTGYPLAAMKHALTETDIDVLLTYAKGTLLDDSIREVLAPVAERRSTGLINAAAVALGLLTPGGSKIEIAHPATTAIREAAAAMVALCAGLGVDVAFLANQYATQRSGCATTLIGTAKSTHLRSAVSAAMTPIDEELLAAVLALRPPEAQRQWISGLPENN